MLHPRRDYYTLIDVKEMPVFAERMIGTKLTLYGEEIGEVTSAEVRDGIIHYTAQIYNTSPTTKNVCDSFGVQEDEKGQASFCFGCRLQEHSQDKGNECMWTEWGKS